jgi:hypothetical protein
VYCQAVLDAVLVEAVAILQDLSGKYQNQLILFGLEPPRDLLLKLRTEKCERGNK